jgi:hypothetical protein
MFVIGMNPYGGLVTKADYLRGKGMRPGSRGAVTVNGDTKEFVAVKLAAGTWVNGTVIRIAPSGGDNVSAAPSTAPSSLLNGRLGVLVFAASATSTQTLAGTAFGWVQVYGEANARVQVVTVSIPGVAMILASVPGTLRPTAAGLASAQADIEGITAISTGGTDGVFTVFLNYPRLTGPFDLNLA